jgi:glutamyl-tRNA synthetase
MGQLGIDPSQGPELTKVVALQQERAKTLVEMAQNSFYFYNDVSEYDEKAAKKNLTDESAMILEDMHQRLSSLSAWEAEPIHEQIKACAEARALGMGKIAQPIRVAITGNTVSPPLDLTLELLGSERTLAAISRAIAWIKDRAE